MAAAATRFKRGAYADAMRILALAALVVVLVLPGARAVTEDDLDFTIEYLKVTQVKRGEILVEDQVVITNPTNESYGGALTFFVPRGATDFQWRFTTVGGGVPGGSPSEEVEVVQSDAAHDLVALDLAANDEAILPGNASSLTFSFRVRADTFSMRFAHDADSAVVQVIAAEDQRPESDELSFSRFQEGQSMWIADGATARSYDKDDTFTIRFVNAPVAAGAASSSLRDNLAWVGVGALSGAFLIGALVKAGILRIAPPRTRAQPGRAALGEVARETLEARRRILMAALKELDMANRAGEISTGVHSPLKAEFMEEAVRVTRELERRAATPENAQ